MADLKARIPCQIETRDDIRTLKRGSETYDEVLQRLYSEYTRETENAEKSH